MDKEQFKTLLSQYLKDKNVTQRWLADEIGVTQPVITNWKQGNFNILDGDKVLKCAKALRLSAAERSKFLKVAGCHRDNFSLEAPIVPVTTRPIIHPCQFFGREAQLKRIFDAWNRAVLEHIAVIGPKRSGKTSLLCYVKRIHDYDGTTLRKGQRHDWLKQPICDWVLVDFENKQMQRPESLWRYVLEKLNLPVPNTDDWAEFTRALEEGLANPTVILMDNIDKGLQLPALDKTFWGEMRHLGNYCDGKVGFCVTSRQPINELVKLAEKLGDSSPFSNTFGTIELGPLTEEEARTLLSYASPRLSQEETGWILEQSQCWPVLLQQFCQTRADCKADEDWKQVGLKKRQEDAYKHLISDQ
jgi:transcriptional regulator with XRE-family HTH domain